ncbi:MAG: DUF4393 domain-containing protein [Gammaproteobacteria bacterium]|nr:DUF4393 domain-containing protein [Gammaproteobacteria bacterium]
MSDEITETAKAVQEVAKATTKSLETSEKIGGFLAKVLGEPIEMAAGILGDKLKFMRWERQIRFMDRVNEVNCKRGIEGKEVPVPPKLVIPIIENASLEEDDLLQDLWVNLISSAQGEESSHEVRTAFIDIIKQLESIDVLILDSIFRGYIKLVDRENIYTESPRNVIFSKETIMSTLKINEQIYEDSIDNLMRVRCLRSEVKIINGISMGGEKPTVDMGYDSLCLTTLGVKFVMACIAELS